jgi:hypothetical protein
MVSGLVLHRWSELVLIGIGMLVVVVLMLVLFSRR